MSPGKGFLVVTGIMYMIFGLLTFFTVSYFLVEAPLTDTPVTSISDLNLATIAILL